MNAETLLAGPSERRYRLGASMGPRSHERGNERKQHPHTSDARASMGPRSHERGNVPEPPKPTPKTKTLQWGRVLMNAETKLTVPWQSFIRVLQWGRVLMNAETSLAEDSHRGPRDASMGPRSHERGNVEKVREVHAFFQEASMGPRSHERGNRSKTLPRRRRSGCFNGAAFS